jgi:pimeloyl-ACP methyl ester carboxylesterase
LMQDRTPASAYATITAPTLFLTGAHSPPAVQRVVALLTEAVPQARRECIAGAGHMGPISHPAAVNEAIARHVDAASRTNGPRSDGRLQ